MKSSFKYALLIVVCTSFASAQEFHLGIRSGLGASALRGHNVLQSLSFGPNVVKLHPAFSASAGLAFAAEVNRLFSIAPELQYTLYQAKGELTLKTGDGFDDLRRAGVNLHSLELPFLVRFNIGSAYIEAGPQVGANLYAVLYKNNELKKPKVNVLAFGPSLGGGVNIKGALFGLRGHFGLLEYAKKTNGYPWAVQASVGKFLF
ncbi:MAG: PorT family protein [Candidatus Fibromonas sp.]|jgi:hypothetical protein|nr:PorT family protein [Candidatus Fibromonas sp.]